MTMVQVAASDTNHSDHCHVPATQEACKYDCLPTWVGRYTIGRLDALSSLHQRHLVHQKRTPHPVFRAKGSDTTQVIGTPQI